MKFTLGKYSFTRNDPLDIFTLAELKTYLNIPTSVTSRDTQLTLWLDSAIDTFMEIAQMGILDTTFTAKFYGFHNYKIYDNSTATSNTLQLFRQKIHTINSVKYYKSNVLTTLANTEYKMDFENMITSILSATDEGFPTDYDTLAFQGKPGAVEIEFVSGFGENVSDIPADVKHALLSYVKESYEDCACGEVNSRFNDLIAKYRYTNMAYNIL